MAAVDGNSRYFRTRQFREASGVTYVLDREPYRYAGAPDDRVHMVRQRETLHLLAERYFAGVPDAALLWWAIADYQPEPILAPPLELEEGTVLYIPAVARLRGEILSDRRRGLDTI